jgi:hypothetical protein
MEQLIEQEKKRAAQQPRDGSGPDGGKPTP